MVKAATKKTSKQNAKTNKASAKKSTAKKSTKKAPAKKASAKAPATKKADSPESDVIQVDRREGERRDPEAKAEITQERRKVSRRRQIDPTTCERDYSNAEIEFMQAMDAYKRSSGRMFPTCSEILEVVRGLGYCRPGEELVGPSAPVFDEDGDLAASDAIDDSGFDVE